VAEAVQSARETIEKAQLSPHDIERIVFVGGPTQYKPLRDNVAFELGINASTDINPMSAVAEGAAVFAESIDWASQSRGRKTSRGALTTGGNWLFPSITSQELLTFVPEWLQESMVLQSMEQNSRLIVWTLAGHPDAWL
jgi:hypothetical protein